MCCTFFISTNLISINNYPIVIVLPTILSIFLTNLNYYKIGVESLKLQPYL